MTDVDTGQTVTRNVWSYYGLQQLDTGHTTIFVAPQGNNCGTWCKADETFISALVSAIEADSCIDTSRVFALGFSYGAIFSYSLACDLPQTFRAVATLEAAQNIGCNAGSTPVGYLGIEGLQDPTCTPDGTSLSRYVRNSERLYQAGNGARMDLGAESRVLLVRGVQGGVPRSMCTGVGAFVGALASNTRISPLSPVFAETRPLGAFCSARPKQPRGDSTAAQKHNQPTNPLYQRLSFRCIAMTSLEATVALSEQIRPLGRPRPTFSVESRCSTSGNDSSSTGRRNTAARGTLGTSLPVPMVPIM